MLDPGPITVERHGRCIGGPRNLQRCSADADSFSVIDEAALEDWFDRRERIGEYRRMFRNLYLWRGWQGDSGLSPAMRVFAGGAAAIMFAYVAFVSFLLAYALL